MDQQSKQGPGQGQGSDKKDDETAAGGNGASNGHDDFPAELARQANAAFEAEKQSVDKGIDAWKKLVAVAPDAWAPRRELARVYKKAERWNAFIEVMKEARREGELVVARGEGPVLLRDGRDLSRSAEARRDGGQRLQPDPDHPADQPRGARRAGRAVRGR